MLVFLSFTLIAFFMGLFRAGPADPLQAFGVVVLLIGAAAWGQSYLSSRARDALRERYRTGLQQYSREFGESDFYRAMVAVNGRGLPTDQRVFKRLEGFHDTLDEATADMFDRRRWAKEAELMELAGELADGPGGYVGGLLLVIAAGIFMTYRLVTPAAVVDVAVVPTAAKLAPVPVTTAAMPATETTETAGEATEFAEAAPPPEPAIRFAYEDCGAVLDAKTDLHWFFGPDYNFQRSDAERYVRGMRECDRQWRLPTSAELQAIYDPRQTAGQGYERDGISYPAKLSPMFGKIGHGTWVWTSGSEPDNAHNLHTGKPVTLNDAPGDLTVRVMAVSP